MGRVQTVQISDAVSNTPLDFETLTNFNNVNAGNTAAAPVTSALLLGEDQAFALEEQTKPTFFRTECTQMHVMRTTDGMRQ